MIDWLTVKFENDNPQLDVFETLWGIHTTRGTRSTYWRFTGEWFTYCEDRDQDAIDIIKDARRLGGKITRVDFAFDYVYEFNYIAYYRKMRQALGKDRVRLNLSRGKTVYVNKRTSARFLRVYDKRAETLNRTDVLVDWPWVRVELEVKRTAVEPYLVQYMTNPDIIRTDVLNRFVLGELDVQTEYDSATVVISRRVAQGDPMEFIRRFRKAILRGYETDKKAFHTITGIPPF